MTTDWIAAIEPWWPVLAAVALGLLLGWLLRGRRAPKPQPQADGPREGGAAEAQDTLAGPTPFPLRPPVDAAQEVAGAQVASEGASKSDTLEAFEQFESKLREWQTYASSEATAVQTIDQPSIDDWDDLMDIDGIDLGLARFLYAEGIHTFDQIAAMSPAELRAVLDRAGTSYLNVDPSSWPESAQRAALAR